MKHKHLDDQNRAEQSVADAEKVRREKPSLDTTPIPNSEGIPDYGCSGRTMELAMAHLEESVPNGQKKRTELAFTALKLAMKNHEVWLRWKGYDV